MKRLKIKTLFSEKRKKSTREERKRGMLYFAFYIAFLPIAAQANVLSTTTNFLGYMTGGWGKVVATIGVAVVGYLSILTGRIATTYLTAVVIGIGFIFGAHDILQHLQGT